MPRLTDKGLLIEESRTNSFTYSEDFSQTSQWDTVKSSVSLDASEVAPDGSTGVYKTEPTASGAKYQWLTVEGNPAHANPNCVSIFAKANGYDYFFIHMSAKDAAVFNLNTGTIESIFSGNSAWIEDFGDGWYRCSVVHKTAKDGQNWGFGCRPTANASQFSADGSSVFIWGAQWEDNKEFPTSYIPTTTAAVTRARDICTILGDNFLSWYNPNNGTILLEGDLTDNPKSGSGSQQLVMIQSQAVKDRFLFEMVSAELRIGSTSGGGKRLEFDFTTPKRKMCLTYSANEGNAAADGDVKTAQTNKPLPTFTVNHALYFGRNAAENPGTAVGRAYFSKLTYYPTRLPDVVLGRLTQ